MVNPGMILSLEIAVNKDAEPTIPIMTENNDVDNSPRIIIYP